MTAEELAPADLYDTVAIHSTSAKDIVSMRRAGLDPRFLDYRNDGS